MLLLYLLSPGGIGCIMSKRTGPSNGLVLFSVVPVNIGGIKVALEADNQQLHFFDDFKAH